MRRRADFGQHIDGGGADIGTCRFRHAGKQFGGGTLRHDAGEIAGQNADIGIGVVQQGGQMRACDAGHEFQGIQRRSAGFCIVGAQIRQHRGETFVTGDAREAGENRFSDVSSASASSAAPKEARLGEPRPRAAAQRSSGDALRSFACKDFCAGQRAVAA